MKNLNVKYSAVCDGTADCLCDHHERARRRSKQHDLAVKFSAVCSGKVKCGCDDHERAKRGER